MMKKTFFINLIFCLILSIFSFSQEKDTLYLDDLREIADTFFGQLNSNYFEGILLNRSLSDHKGTLEQINGNYNQIHDIVQWTQLLQDIQYSYEDTNRIMTNYVFYNELKSFYEIHTTGKNDDLKVPFGLILQNVSVLDSVNLENEGYSIVNHQLIPNIEDQHLYIKTLLKSACVVEVNPDNGYDKGVLIYHPNFILTSDDIEIQRIQIDAGNGFKLFNENNPLLYDRDQDSIVGKLAVSYTLHNELIFDTLNFYLTTNLDVEQSFVEKSGHTWDILLDYKGNEIDFTIGIKYRCDREGNEINVKRPIIIAPPYRPAIQPFSMNKYYNQFNVAGLFDLLNAQGYDVIFLREEPGNARIEKAGRELARYLTLLNEAKREHYPEEDWENILMGFSAGGQHARYALMYLEEKHMNEGGPHHHTRLYIPFDSPHWGANVPMFTQTVYHEFKHNPLTYLAYSTLCDAASKDMLAHHILGSNLTLLNEPNLTPGHYNLSPGPTAERQQLVNDFNTKFIHQFTPLNDLRRSFPTFTRNISISVGNNNDDYDSEYGLFPGKLLFRQQFTLPSILGVTNRRRRIFASNGAGTSTVFLRDDVRFVLMVPFPIRKNYATLGAYTQNWDIAQGGHKNEFYDGLGTGAIFHLRVNAGAGILLGTKYYHRNVNFLPLVSSLAIHPDLWQNDLLFRVKAEGLMFNNFDIQNNPPSNIYGYPNLGHPNTHFNITPFEAIYVDPQTYEHIKLEESVEYDDLDPEYLVNLRDFIVNEVEANEVFLQNKIIGKNHVQWNPDFTYKAWYKARNSVTFGRKVTPKTDEGDYVIEKTGEINTYAGNAIYLKPGFHAQNGSSFHAWIEHFPCRSITIGKSTDQDPSSEKDLPVTDKTISILNIESTTTDFTVFPNPTHGKLTFSLLSDNPYGEIIIYSMLGQEKYRQPVTKKQHELNLSLEGGIYIIVWKNGNITKSKKIIVH